RLAAPHTLEVPSLNTAGGARLKTPGVSGGARGAVGKPIPPRRAPPPRPRSATPAGPGPGEGATCETAGVLGPTVNIVASYQATEAIKILTGRTEAINRDLIYLDVWENVFKKFSIAKLRERGDCVCCKQHKFEWLEGQHGSQTTSLCGRNAVQVSHRVAGKLDFEGMATQLKVLGQVSFNRFMLKFNVEEYEFTVFPDGRAIIKGTNDADKARTLYAKYI